MTYLHFPREISNKAQTKIHLEIINEGYASTYNYRFAELILRNKESGKVYRKRIDCDTRYWFADELRVLDLEFKWPEHPSTGKYELFLNLPDPNASLYNRTEYSIRLASTYKSKPIWVAETGWNLLLPEILVI